MGVTMKAKIVAALAGVAMLLVGAATMPLPAVAATLKTGTYLVHFFVTNIVENGENTTCGFAASQNGEWFLVLGKTTSITIADEYDPGTIILSPLPNLPKAGGSWGSGPYTFTFQPGNFTDHGTWTGTITTTSPETFIGTNVTFTNWPAPGGIKNACNVTVKLSAILLP